MLGFRGRCWFTDQISRTYPQRFVHTTLRLADNVGPFRLSAQVSQPGEVNNFHRDKREARAGSTATRNNISRQAERGAKGRGGDERCRETSNESNKRKEERAREGLGRAERGRELNMKIRLKVTEFETNEKPPSARRGTLLPLRVTNYVARMTTTMTTTTTYVRQFAEIHARVHARPPVIRA